tara:strand:+ start:366 stop:473 length:108 start_codon:yes stop_codon:yes gene_type:complete
MFMILSIIDEWLKEKYEEKQNDEFLKKELQDKTKN